MARGNGDGAVAVLAMIEEKKNSAGLGGLLVDKSETVIAVTGEEIESDKRVVGELLLPAGAGNGETRLTQAAGRKHELAGDGAEDDDRPAGIVKGVELLLVKGLADDGEIRRGAIRAPAGGVVGEGGGKRHGMGGGGGRRDRGVGVDAGGEGSWGWWR